MPIKSTTVPLYPQVTVQGLFGVSQSGFPFPDDTYQALANLSRTQSRHFLKFGMDIRHMRNLDDGLFSGIFTFTKDPTADPQNVASTGQAIAAYLLGLPNMAQRNIGDTTAIMRNNLYHFYAQDDFKVTSRLTLEYPICRPSRSRSAVMVTCARNCSPFLRTRHPSST